jgi:ArsR family transcriptional regulator, arsenate/arsenite/antimonite-responsive transcriptional repressor
MPAAAYSRPMVEVGVETKQVIEALSALAAEALQVPASSLSFHLAHLSRAGLLTQRRESRSLIYAVDFAGMNALMGYLTENCCGGDMSKCAPACATPAADNSQRKQSA